MNTTEIKKALYKEKPMAIRSAFPTFTDECDYAHYVAQLNDKSIVQFEIPMNEAENFASTEPAQLLIRWIKN